MSQKKHDLFCRIPETLFQQIKTLAEAHKRSVSAEVEWVLEQHVKNHAADLPTSKPKSKPKRK